MEADALEQNKKYEELQKKLKEDKLQRIEERHRKLEESKLERLKFREETSKNYREVMKVKPLYIEKNEKF